LIDVPDPNNTRLQIDTEELVCLINSIASIGLINPITLRKNGPRFELIAGNRRLTAVRRLGKHAISAIVLEVDDLTRDTVCLSENLQRSNLSPVEEAVALNNLVENNPAGVDGVAATVSRGVNWILDRLEILNWPPSLQEAVHTTKISLAAAKRIARIQPDELRETRIHQAAAHGINARTASLWLQDANAEEPQVSTPPENTGFGEHAAQIPETTIPCWLCQAQTIIHETKPLRICATCISSVHAQVNAQQTPPTH
jgi:ParB/RepB/Spo0J family partition protein